MNTDQSEPLHTADLLQLDEQSFPERDGRPWGHTNDYAFPFWCASEITLERADIEGGYLLRGNGPILHGIPLVDEEGAEGRVIARTVGEREHARQMQKASPRTESRNRSDSRADGFCPSGVPVAYLPRILTSIQDGRRGQSARGGTALLSDTVVTTQDGPNHSTIFNGESRDFLRPDFFPYTAVCKLELWQLDTGGRGWVASGDYASGFLIGRSTLLTSGHAFEGRRLGDGVTAIKVIPACWANNSVFGAGMITWVRRRRWWHSDSGNDLQLCQLADPVGDRLGFFGARVYDSDWEDRGVWTMAGFPYDRSKFGMSVQHGIHVRDDDDGDDIELAGDTYDTTQVESDADEASGASGSPLFAWFGEGNPCAVGVHSGSTDDWTVGGTETWACAAGGDGLVAIVNWARDNWD